MMQLIGQRARCRLIFSREGFNAPPAVDRDQPKSGGALTAARLVATMLT
jgi:hypothetical protein